MSSRWGEDTTILFVAEYVKQEVLWNVKHELYKNKQARQVAINYLEEVMNLPGFTDHEIKTKIKNIRSTYAQELKKIKDSKATGTEYVYVPAIKWFQPLHVVLKDMYSEIKNNNLSLIIESIENNSTEESTSTQQPIIDPNKNKRRRVTQFNNTTPNLESLENQSVEEGTSAQQPPTHLNKNKRQRLAQLKTMVNQLKEIAETVNTPVGENEFEVFGRNVGLQLKAMPLQIALEAQQYIQTYLSKIRLQQLTDQNTYFQPILTNSPSDSDSINDPIEDSYSTCTLKYEPI